MISQVLSMLPFSLSAPCLFQRGHVMLKTQYLYDDSAFLVYFLVIIFLDVDKLTIVPQKLLALCYTFRESLFRGNL